MVDTETTGLDVAAGHALVEVGTVTVDDGAIGETWSTLVNPGRPIPPDATAVHGIDDAAVARAPGPAEAAPELRRRCGEAVLVFHNAAFDLPFLARLLRAGGAPLLFNPVLDTLGLARGLSAVGGHSLGALAERFGIDPASTHRAAPDARRTAELLLALAPRWERDRGVRTLLELAAISQDVLRSRPRATAV